MEIVDNTEMRHFEVQDDNGLAYIEYQIQEKKYFLTKVSFPKDFEESGKAGEMMELVLKAIEDSGLRSVPMTKFAKQYFKANRQWKHLLPAGIHL